MPQLGRGGESVSQKTLGISLRSYQIECQTHDHPDYCQIILPEKGILSLAMDGRDYQVAPTDFAVIPAGMSHQYASQPEDNFCILDVPTDVGGKTWLADGQYRAQPDSIRALKPYLYYMAQHQSADIQRQQALALCLSHLSAEFDTDSGRLLPAQLQKLHQYIARYYAFPLTVAEMADYTDTSQSHLYRLCQQYYQKTPQTLVRDYRLEAARKRLVAQPEETITQIAHACGFADQSHFSRHFRQWQGQTASAYRKSQFQTC